MVSKSFKIRRATKNGPSQCFKWRRASHHLTPDAVAMPRLGHMLRVWQVLVTISQPSWFVEDHCKNKFENKQYLFYPSEMLEIYHLVRRKPNIDSVVSTQRIQVAFFRPGSKISSTCSISYADEKRAACVKWWCALEHCGPTPSNFLKILNSLGFGTTENKMGSHPPIIFADFQFRGEI